MELPFYNFDPIHLPKRPQYKWGKVDAISVWFSGSPASLDRRHYSSHCRVTLRRAGLTYVTGAGSKWEVPAAPPAQGTEELKCLAKHPAWPPRKGHSGSERWLHGTGRSLQRVRIQVPSAHIEGGSQLRVPEPFPGLLGHCTHVHCTTPLLSPSPHTNN